LTIKAGVIRLLFYLILFDFKVWWLTFVETKKVYVMKLLLIALLFIVQFYNFHLSAQDYEFPVNSKGEIEFSEVVDINNFNKDLLFSNAKEWVATTFGDYKRVIQYEDKEEGKLILKGASDIPYIAGSISERLEFTITIECKDEKYRYKISDIDILLNLDIVGLSGSKKINRNKHLLDIEIYKKEIIQKNKNLDGLISTTNYESLRQREKDKFNERKNSIKGEIYGLEKKILDEETFYIQEYETLKNIIASLKERMCFNDDF